MIDHKDFRINPDKYFNAARQRGLNVEHEVKTTTTNETSRQQQLENLQAQINRANKIIPSLTNPERAEKLKELKKISDKISGLKSILKSTSKNKKFVWPNIPRSDVPIGTGSKSNQIIRQVGKKPKLEQPQDYLTLTEKLKLIDIKRASKVSGSRFGYLLGLLAQMEFALIHYAQSIIIPAGFTMVIPPVMIKEENMAAMGYLSGAGEQEAYHLAKEHLYLVGTSEQSIGPMHRDEVLNSDQLPKRYLAFSTCFRREAGSYGQDTRGILRVHQFDKLEMFSFTQPNQSDQEHELLLSLQEKIMTGLKLPYRVVKLCTGELSWPSARTYDLETWMPGQNLYRETHSTSNTTDYQSRDLNIYYQRSDEPKELVHTLNGTAVAIGRMLIAIIENYQQPGGSIAVPKVLQSFLRQKVIR